MQGRVLGIAASMASPTGQLAYPLGDALYLNLTNACTLSCVFCPKVRDDDWTIAGHDLRLARNPTADEVWIAALNASIVGRSEVVFTGVGESTLRLSVLLELIKRLKQADVRRVRLDTDGLANLREGRDVVPDMSRAGLDAVSISLNAPDASTYARLCCSHYGETAWHAAREFVRCAKLALPEVTVSFVAVPELIESECRRFAETLGVAFRWREYQTAAVANHGA